MVQQIYAQIEGQVIKNIIICEDYETANWLSRMAYGDQAFAVDCSQYRCDIGYIYRDGVFLHIEDGIEKPVEYIPMAEESIEDLKSENTMLQLALAEQYEQNLALQDEVSNTQLALAEIYEGMEV